jgi:two-component system LytT family sensor kinase
MNPLKRRSYITVLLHVLLWMLFAFTPFFILPLTWNVSLPYQFWIKQGGVIFMLIGIFYINSNILVSRLLLKNKVFLFIISVVILSLLVGPLAKLLDEVLHLQEAMNETFQNLGMRPIGGIQSEIFNSILTMMALFIVTISTSVSLMQKWQADKILRESLEKAKIGSELSFLKAQINPHFFFNTLNNIYALTYVDVETSRSALHKLSRMMRYLLYDTQTGITPLSQELSFVKDYIELMELRLNDTTKVLFKKPDLQEDIQIPPMLFLPYIENAFKYGVSTTVSSEISIEFILEDNRLDMIVKNVVFNENIAAIDEYSGIGLTNTKRRLDLLYPGKHVFIVRRTDENEFIVHLTLILKDA